MTIQDEAAKKFKERKRKWCVSHAEGILRAKEKLMLKYADLDKAMADLEDTGEPLTQDRINVLGLSPYMVYEPLTTSD